MKHTDGHVDSHAKLIRAGYLRQVGYHSLGVSI